MSETIERPVSQVPLQTSRPTAPAGMTYNRRGELVKKRIQKQRTNKVFIVMQVVGEDGQPCGFGKSNVNILGILRNSDKVLELMESGRHPEAFYVRHDFSAPT